MQHNIKTVAVIGGGLIGMSWTSLFLAQGLRVVVVDPRPEAKAETREFVKAAWDDLTALGLVKAPEICSAEFLTEISDLSGIDFVQECGPDRIEVKRVLVQQLEAVIGEGVVIASSTSSLMASDIQEGATHPARILVAHPMNPPHVLPMVELVAGGQTAPATVDLAEAFYQSLERTTIRVQKEVVGHLANRLTSALYREAVHIVAEGIAPVEDVDKAISSGPGMRWALMGPHLAYHLGGGKGGYQHYLDHLGPTQEARWREHGSPKLTEEVKQKLVAGIEQEMLTQDEATLPARRDAALVEIAKLKKRFDF